MAEMPLRIIHAEFAVAALEGAEAAMVATDAPLLLKVELPLVDTPEFDDFELMLEFGVVLADIVLTDMADFTGALLTPVEEDLEEAADAVVSVITAVADALELAVMDSTVFVLSTTKGGL